MAHMIFAVTDFCASQPCQHGNYSKYLGNYTCTCDTGYGGRDCDTRKSWFVTNISISENIEH